MSPWSKRMLVVAMVAWSALTVGVGWYALHGKSTPASASSRATGTDAIIARVKSNNAAGAAAGGGAPAAVASSTAGVSTPGAVEATPRPPLSLQPIPAHAASAGAGGRASSLDADGPRSAPPRPVSRGVIVLDPGHGRGDPGAVHHTADGSVDITEADSNRRNAELIRDELTALGYEVYLTRSGEGQGPGAPLPLQFITSDLYARIGLAKAVDANLYLALHGNGATVPFLSGPETWYCGRHAQGAANEKLAQMVQQAMMDALHEYGYNPPDRGIKEDAQSHHSGDFCQFVVTRETPTPAALLEFLFLTNDDDAKVLLDDRVHVLLAKHVAAALDTFMQERAAQP
jgi:N-acetylmuramoyl-L-alanine amidase